jgi:poly(hydroxyalkanoate) granule-associated protein
VNPIPTGINIGGALDKVLATGRNLWLAGVGAVAEVTEGGLEVFDHLVERGRPVEEKQKQLVEAVTGRATRTVREAQQLVEDTVEFESRGVLKRLNVMTREDVKILSARIETLSKKVDETLARRHAATVEPVEIVTPQGEPAAIVIPVTTTAAKAKTAKPRATKKATR